MGKAICLEEDVESLTAAAFDRSRLVLRGIHAVKKAFDGEVIEPVEDVIRIPGSALTLRPGTTIRALPAGRPGGG